MFRVIICGSREYTDFELLSKTCDYYLSQKLNSEEEVVIVSGCARGADTLGEKYAMSRGLKVMKFPADWNKYGKKAGFIRNEEMAKNSDACIAFLSREGKNVGTKMMISLASVYNLPTRVVQE